MYGAIYSDELITVQSSPQKWDELNVINSYFFWYIVELDHIPYKHIPLTSEEAYGSFFCNDSGTIKVYEGSNLLDIIPFEKWVKHPKKHKVTGEEISWPMRYKYTFTEEDKKQGMIFIERMKPYVQCAIKSQARRKRFNTVHRVFKRMF